MAWTDCPNSKKFLRFSYNSETQKLLAQFRANPDATFEYDDFTQEDFEALKEAEHTQTLATFFDTRLKRVKDGKDETGLDKFKPRTYRKI